ncbi:hypothetical protein ACFLS1_05540 [Verrucomicrobiota bacterium]
MINPAITLYNMTGKLRAGRIYQPTPRLRPGRQDQEEKHNPSSIRRLQPHD